jgi:hypothetical protein
MEGRAAAGDRDLRRRERNGRRLGERAAIGGGGSRSGKIGRRGRRRSSPPRTAGEQGARPPLHASPAAGGKAVKGEAEPDGATFSWLCLLCGSRNGLQVRLLGWSCFICTRLARLRVELVLEPLPKPCQTGPQYLLEHNV